MSGLPASSLVWLYGIGALFGFGALVACAILYIKHRLRALAHFAAFVLSLFLICVAQFATTLAGLIDVSPRAFGDSSIPLAVANAAMTVLFIYGGLMSLADLVGLSAGKAFRGLVLAWTAANLLLHAIALALGISARLSFLLNLSGLWLPGAAALVIALVRIRHLRASPFRIEATAFALGSALNLAAYAASLQAPAIAAFAPFVYISLFSSFVIVVAARHFAHPAYLEAERLSDYFMARYGITPRERDIVERLLAGDSNKDIALALEISLRTVETHLGNIYRKTGAESRLDLCSMIRSNA